ncbi:MAG: FAD-binding domain-containing protein [Myxococcota bacterium]
MPVDPLRLHLPDTRTAKRGDFVLYWMQGTFRAHHNFALAYAVEEADARGLPVLVYHGLRHDYPWANDRLHTFVLESVAALVEAFAARGIPYAFWLGQGGDEPGRTALVELAERAALVVTDYLPTFIHPGQIRGLRRKVTTPVVAVDSATVVPVRFHDRPHASARGIRPVLMRALPRFLADLPEERAPRVTRRVDLPFTPTRPTVATIPSLVAGLPIDHTVPPVAATRGGTAAGQARLAAFLANGLPRYAAERGDPNADATSRLSPYLHFGNVSPHEVIGAVRAVGDENAEKFLDEALVWRELSYNFCHFDPRHRTVHAIPAWAQEQLSNHVEDPRPALFPLDRLAAAATGEPLWDAAQRQYLREGWMHNALRMLWGKTVLAWTPDAATALAHLEALNNRYSLDGRDASTYASLHWIFGKFDRPFYRRPIYGTVRYMSLKTAKDKFDVGALLRRYPA